jgi:NhaP-type Na+/H+ or K+/H+ antiporter
VLIGLALILVIRPVAGVVALTRSPALSREQGWAVAFFGVRGIGSIYYLAYAAGASDVLAVDWLWSTVAFTVVASVFVHGALSTPVLRLVGRT